MTPGSSQGYQSESTVGSDFNSQRSVILGLLSKIRTATPCIVLSCTNSGGVTPVGTVDLQPMVNQMAANGQTAAPQGVIHGVPYMRVTGGTNAVIMDPQVGDFGLAVFADSDISTAVSTAAVANAGSGRQFDVSDALFFGWMSLGVTPVQYAQFDADGIKLVSPKLISLTAPDVRINASTVEINGTTSVTVTTPTYTVNATNIALNGITAIVGDTSVTGTMENNGVDIGSGHEHDVELVQTGTSTITTTSPVS